jgi:membrane-associated phospholipid phosphatase
MLAFVLLLAPAQPADVVLTWNEETLQTVRDARTPPPLAARHLALVHIALYDAVAAVRRTHRPYAVEAVPVPGTSEEAAAAAAAARVLEAVAPDRAEHIRAALGRSLAAVPDGPGKDRGLDLGNFVAGRVLALRAADGADARAPAPPQRLADQPGLWRPTPPDYRPPLAPHWPRVACFAMRRGDQFRSPPPPGLDGAAYALDLAEVRRLGAVNSVLRSREQTEIARFWEDGPGTVTPPGHWNRIAQAVARGRGLNTADSARLFALLNVALADAGIACWDAKYHYRLWRPVHAIREADRAVTPGAEADPDWLPLLPTPPFPSYPSGHSTFSGAAAAVLAAFFGGDAVAFVTTSERLPGVEHAFAGFWAAAEEAGRSRIYGGIHYEFDNSAGLASGRSLGEYVSRNFLLPRPPQP